jgi:hypothetical protein|tara:strand:+ start:38 stop:418 length:381 start_codon:yes stop_codon:yes gene_type:complete
MSCCGNKTLNAEGDDENADSPDFCTASPETYSREARLNKSLQVGGIFAVLGAGAAHFMLKKDGFKDSALMGVGTGTAALLGNYILFGDSIMSDADTHYSNVCPTYTGGADEEQDEQAEVDNADIQP